jgi:hypothetical protein
MWVGGWVGVKMTILKGRAAFLFGKQDAYKEGCMGRRGTRRGSVCVWVCVCGCVCVCVQVCFLLIFVYNIISTTCGSSGLGSGSITDML